MSFSTYGMPENSECVGSRSDGDEEKVVGLDININRHRPSAKRKKSRSLDLRGRERSCVCKAPVQRFNSLPNENLVRTEQIFENREALELMSRLSRSSSTGTKPERCELEESGFIRNREAELEIVEDTINIKDDECESRQCCSFQGDMISDFSANSKTPVSKELRSRPPQAFHSPLRRIKSSISSLSSLRTESTGYDSGYSDGTIENFDAESGEVSRKRKLGIVLECPETTRKAVSDNDLSLKSKQIGNIYFV